MDKKILYRGDGLVGHIAFNNPKKLNSFDFHTIKELSNILDKIAKSRVRVVVVAGNGKAFSSGGDIEWEKEIGTLSKQEAKAQISFVQKTFSRMESMPQVFIALIDGYAVGGGNELAMACDIRIATENAKFLHPEVSLGTVAPLGATKRLPRLIGSGRAKYMFFTGESIGGKKAVEWGLADFLVSEKKIKEFMGSLLKKIAEKPVHALYLTKKSINSSFKKDLLDNFEAESYIKCSRSMENKELLDSFMKKKK
ncbi:enoyl-CoA hydratase/isomerase family protein [Candidatus Woesearchaeota archaeon]|nr:enoyl-CoA hydratase/isomerase family protein [Candidatus Woesearchaeota archaeon]